MPLISDAYGGIPDALRKQMEIANRLQRIYQPFAAQQAYLSKIQETIERGIPKFQFESPIADTLSAIDFPSVGVDLSIGVQAANEVCTLSAQAIHGIATTALQNAAMAIPPAAVLEGIQLTEIAQSISSLGNIGIGDLGLNDALSRWLDVFDFSYLNETLELIQRAQSITFDLERYKRRYIRDMYDAEWFPYVGWNVSLSLAFELNDILAHTRKSKNRVKQIDKAVIGYYTKKRLDAIRREWKNSDLSKPIRDIMCQAIKAYQNKEYACVSITLSSLWQAIIFEKANDPGGRKDNPTKRHFKELVEWNAYDEIFADFFNNFIMKDCRSPEQNPKGIPARNGNQHGWHKEVPTQKAALNAIMLTDFLVRLEPLGVMEEIA